MALRELTYKQRIFVAAYLGQAGGNATEAARIAGYSWPEKQGYQLLGKTSIKAAVATKLAQVAMSSDEVLARLSDMASADVAEFLDIKDDGSFDIDVKGAKRRGKTHLIKKLTPTKFGLAIELHDSQAALEKLGRYYGVFNRDANQGVTLDARQADALLELAEGDAGVGDDDGDEDEDEYGEDGPGAE